MSPQQQLEALINTFEPRIRDAFLRAIAGVVDNTILQQVIDAIVVGDPQKAFDALSMDEAAMHPLTVEIQDAFERAGSMKADSMPRGPGPFFRFNMRNTRAEQWLREKSSQLITTITEDARINVMNTIEAGVREGRNPRSIALDIVGHKDIGTGHRVGGIVGLNQNQEGWVRSAKNKLGARFGEDGVYTAPSPDYFELDLRDKRFDGTVQAAIDAGKPLSQETVDNLVTRYKSNALRHRGEMIARHEAIEALNHAEWESTKQAVERGKVKASAVTREWDSAGDKRVRLSHALMDGQRVGLDEPFVSPVTGAHLMFPGDTSLGASAGETAGCRCRVKTIIDFFAK